MSSRSLEIYAARARTIADTTVASGRLLNSKSAERLIVPDVIHKLELGPEDTLLDIGAGIGTLAIPLSFLVRSVTAVDHADVLARLQARAPLEAIETIAGNFFDLDLGERRFSRILAYDVVHYLGTHAEVLAFVDAAIGLLEPHGKMLIGDIRNDDVLERILGTDAGQRYAAHWTLEKVQTSQEQKALESGIETDHDLSFNDDRLLALLRHVRTAGHQAYLLRQDPGLPLWHQREDVLIERLVPGPKRVQVVATMVDGRATILGLREAGPDDSDAFYAWTQDPAVKAASLRPSSFTIEEHREWFSRKLADRECVRMFVLEQEATLRLGQVRYELVRTGRPLYTGGPDATDTDGAAEVSLSLDAGARGMRLSKYALDASYQIARAELGFTVARALIKPDNQGSVKAFMRAGFQYITLGERLGQQVMVLER